MKIFYDHQIFSLQRFGGASRLFAELISGINNETNHQAYLSILSSINEHLNEKEMPLPLWTGKLPLLRHKGIIPPLNDLLTCLDI